MQVTQQQINGDSATEYCCEYGCGQNATQTEISETPYGTYICGDIECWNAYCWEWVWTGDVVEVTEEEINVKKKGRKMSFNVRESILAYWRMFKFFGTWILIMGIVFLIAKMIKG